MTKTHPKNSLGLGQAKNTYLGKWVFANINDYQEYNFFWFLSYLGKKSNADVLQLRLPK